MSSQSRKDRVQLPQLESQLDEKQKDLLSKALGHAAETSGALALPPATSVPMAASFAEAMSSPPVMPDETLIQHGATLSMAAAIGALPGNDPVAKMTTAMLQQQIEQSARVVAAAPITTASATLMYNSRKISIPETVRDVPNKITVQQPERAYDLYQFFLSELGDDEYDKLLKFANRSNSKPLMWLSEKLYFTLQVERWVPADKNSAKSFSIEDSNPTSSSYQLLMQTFGMDCGSAILVTAERLDMSLLCLIGQVGEYILDKYHKLIKSNNSSQVVDSYKRKKKAVS